MSGQLEAIVRLHKAQTELVDAETRLHGIPDWMQELHEEHSGRKSEIDALGVKRDEATQARRAAEAELSDAQEKVKRYQSQISQVTTQREYTALLKEIDTVKSQIAEREQEVLSSIEAHDEAEKEIASLTEAFHDLDQRYKAELDKWEAEKPDVARRVEELKGQVGKEREKLPRPILSLFDRIYERYSGQAVSRVVRIPAARGGNAMWHCEACSYNVRPQVAVEIRNAGATTQCDGCKRILYIEDDDE